MITNRERTSIFVVIDTGFMFFIFGKNNVVVIIRPNNKSLSPGLTIVAAPFGKIVYNRPIPIR